MAYNWIKARQTKYWTYAGTYIIVILAVLGAVNFLANRYDKSYDATANKQFSLSDQTIKVVKELKRDIHATYFGDTASFGAVGGARDLLDRYAALSPKFHVAYIDPERKPAQAKAVGFRSDSPVLIDSGVRKEGAKSLSEEEITAAIIRSLKSGARNVCMLNAANEHSIDETGSGGYSILKQLVERDNYTVKTIDLKPPAPDASKPLAVGQTPAAAAVEIPKDCTVLVVGGPQLDYTPAVVNAIKAYEEGGGRVLIMLDNILRIGRSEAAAENPELTKLLADWGVTVNKDLVLDLSGVGQLFGLPPEVPVLLSYDSHPITQPLTRVPTAFPLVRSLDIKSGDKTSVSKLFGTTEESVAVTGIGPNGAIDTKKGKKGPLTLAAAGTYSGATQGRFIVVGTSLWAQNSILGSRSLGNRDLFANMINWLSSDEDLISIRPKIPEDRPLNLTTQKLTSIFWLSFVIFPLGVVAIGMATWWKRR
ncbi:MAG TPA: GldG family protein [Bryobacteraceae bacterium]|nr:GldG family protein [Bryobacteraceae bacterium]